MKSYMFVVQLVLSRMIKEIFLFKFLLLLLLLTNSAGVAKLVDAPDLGSGAFGRVGSSPITRTIL